MADAAARREIQVSQEGQAGFCDNTLVTSKYTVLNFVGKNLWEQFQRVANVYFLVIATLQVSGYITPALDLSPTHKLATISPLTLMLILTALKEAMEDYARHVEDRKVNNQNTTVVTRDGPTQVAWRDVRVGQVLKIEDDQSFPADMVLLRTQMQGEKSSKCYVETAELDGETNLKIRHAQNDVWDIVKAGDESSLFNVCDAEVNCDHPNGNLYKFKGQLVIDGRPTIGLNNECVLYRGAKLKNTDHIYGIVVYTGKETKLSKNMTEGPLKRSNVEQLVDRLIRFIFIALIAVVFVSSVFNLVFQAELADRDVDGPFYLQFLAKPVHAIDALFAFITFLILFNTFVPISLYVTLETVKVFQSNLIANDHRMFYEERDMWAQARTSNLHEDLGQIEYVFSDKTGTLTRNEMVFKKASYGPYPDERSAESAPVRGVKRDASPTGAEVASIDDPSEKQCAEEFFTLLSLCHTVVPEPNKDGDGIKYVAESPDEEALVKGAKDAGYEFTAHTSAMDTNGTVDQYHIMVDGVGERRYKRLAVNEFTSTRKRMSAVFKTPENEYVAYAKGADTFMEKYCDVTIPDTAKNQMQEFAEAGLRTLVTARKKLTEQEYLRWKSQYDQASLADDRDAELDKAAESLEKGMKFVGVTAIEDKLQDGVPDAIASLRAAGLNIWVLTGDKQETAVNIARSCRLFDSSMEVRYIQGSPEGVVEPYSIAQITGTIDAVRKVIEERGEVIALVVDGKALGELFRPYELTDGEETKFLQGQTEAKKMLVDVAKSAAAVVGCRVSPKQKRDIVKLVKDNSTPTPMTLAIGDGANDVSMIQEAHIGIGISGNEGMQAVRSADYAIGQFEYLKQLMLVHGRWNYRRVCSVILYSFYKGIAFNLTLFCFGFFNGSSGTTLYDSWLGSGWNVIWTFLPVIFLGALDQDVAQATALDNPRLYKVGLTNSDLNREKMGVFVLTSLSHALILFGIVYGTFHLSVTAADGTTDGLYIMGTTLNGCLQLTVNYKIVVMSRRLTFWNALIVVGSAASWFFFVVGYSEVFALSQGKFYGVSDQLYNRYTFWLLVLIAPFTAILPDLVVTYIQLNYFPREWDELRDENRAQKGEPSASLLSEGSPRDQNTPRGSRFSSFDYTTATDGVAEHAEFASADDTGDTAQTPNMNLSMDVRELSPKIGAGLFESIDATDHLEKARLLGAGARASLS